MRANIIIMLKSAVDIIAMKHQCTRIYLARPSNMDHLVNSIVEIHTQTQPFARPYSHRIEYGLFLNELLWLYYE